MKKLILPLFTFIIWFSQVSLFSQDGWLNQRKEINLTLNDCSFPTDNMEYYGDNYWIAGDSGLILKSNSFANAWSQLQSGTQENLRGVYFFHNGTGFCVGDNGILIKTENFGNHWSSIPLGISTDLNDIWFIDDSTGIIIGDSGLYIESFDRGLNWLAGNLNTDQNLNKIRQLTSSLIWIAGDSGTAFKTIDGGNNWQLINTGHSTDFNDVYLPDDECVYIAGDEGLVIKSENSGQTWMDLSVPVTSDLHGIACTNCYNIYVCGDQGSLYYRTSSTDTNWNAYEGDTGGLNYHSLTLLPYDYDFLFLADSGSFIYLMSYSGYSNLQKAGDNLFFKDIEFIDPFKGFIACNTSTLLHTTDGGENWYSLHLGDFQGNEHGLDLYDVDFVDSLHGYVVAERYMYNEHSHVFGTSDGGMTWTDLFYSTSLALNCMFFLDADHGWVGGERGFMMRTDNAGQYWTIVQPATYNVNYVQQIYFYNQEDGYMIRDYGDFFVTHDGGNTWQFMMDFGMSVNNFAVARDTIIWVLANSVGVYKSVDGGSLWSYRQIPYNGHYANSLCFINENEGWIAGTDQSLWHTYDGGDTWIMEWAENNQEDFNQITFANSANGWILGQDGSIMHGPGLYVGVPEIQDVESDNLFIFPNPAQTMVNIKIPDQNPDLTYSLAIYNVIGQQMIRKVIKEDKDTFTLDISSYQPGIYIVVCRQESEVISSGKFIIISKK
jgi:photosystem II stability/assembly factor-like uncharacterized protein